MGPNLSPRLVAGAAVAVVVGGIVAVATVADTSPAGRPPKVPELVLPLPQLAAESASPGGYEPAVKAREAAEREMPAALDAIAGDVRVALGPTLLDVHVDRNTMSDCTRLGDRHERMECSLRGRVVVLVRFDGSFRDRMVALDRRLRAAGWGVHPKAAGDTSLRGVMVDYWDEREETRVAWRAEGKGDYSIGDLAMAGYHRKPGDPRRGMTVEFYDEDSDPPLWGSPATPAPVPGLRRGTFALVLSVHQRYFHEPPPSAAG